MQVYLTLKKRSGKEDLCPIYVIISESRNNRKYISTNISVHPNEWNPEKKIIRRSHPDAQNLNDIISAKRYEVESKINEILKETPHINWHTLIELYNRPESETFNQRKMSFWEAFDVHVERMKGKVSTDTIKDFLSLKKHLTYYEKKYRLNLCWEDMTYQFYERFSLFLETGVKKPNGDIGLAKNTAGKQIKNLKSYLRKSMRRDYCPNINLEGWKVETEIGDHVYVSEEELDIIWNWNFSDNTEYEKIRDLFIVGCETGLRISDFTSDLSFAMEEKLIRYTVQKTLQKVVIPISPRLREVIDKYDGGFPVISKYKFNTQIKEVLRICGLVSKIQRRKVQGGKKTNEWIEKYKMVSSHTCRRSFCTNMYKRGIPSPVIRQVSGHSTDKALMRYVKVDANEAAEAILANWGGVRVE